MMYDLPVPAMMTGLLDAYLAGRAQGEYLFPGENSADFMNNARWQDMEAVLFMRGGLDGATMNNARHAVAGYVFDRPHESQVSWAAAMNSSTLAMTGLDMGRQIGDGRSAYTAAQGKVEAGNLAIQEMSYLSWYKHFEGFFVIGSSICTVQSVTLEGTAHLVVWEQDALPSLKLPDPATACIMELPASTLVGTGLSGLNAPRYGIDGWGFTDGYNNTQDRGSPPLKKPAEVQLVMGMFVVADGRLAEVRRVDSKIYAHVAVFKEERHSDSRGITWRLERNPSIRRLNRSQIRTLVDVTAHANGSFTCRACR